MKNTDMQGSSRAKSSSKLFVSGVLVLTIANVIVKAIGLLFKIPMQHMIGDEGMGYFNSAYTIYTWFYMISTAGLPVAISILVSENRVKGNFRQVKRILRFALLLFLGIGLLGTSLMTGFSRAFASTVSEKAMWCIIAIAPTLLFVCITSAFRGYFQGYQQMIPTAISEVIESAGKLILGLIFAFWAKNGGYESFCIIFEKYGIEPPDELPFVAAAAIFGLTVGVFLGMLFMWFVKLRFKEEYYNLEYAHLAPEKEQDIPASELLKKIFIIALPVTISSSVMSLANLVDLLLMSNLLQASGLTPDEAAAAYGNYTTLAVPLFNLPPVLIYPIATAIVPMLTARMSEGRTNDAKNIIFSSLKVAAIIALPCALGMSAMSYPILDLMFPSESAASAAPLLSVLSIAIFFLGMLSMTNSILQANKKQWLPIISMLSGAAVKLISEYILISTYGIIGTPISTLLCYITCSTLNFIFVAKYAKIIPPVKIFLKPLVAALGCAVAAKASFTLFGKFIGHSSICTILSIMVAGIVYLGLLFAVKTFDRGDFDIIPKGKKIYSVLEKYHIV
jgi:stage V sporulation protein B